MEVERAILVVRDREAQADSVLGSIVFRMSHVIHHLLSCVEELLSRCKVIALRWSPELLPHVDLLPELLGDFILGCEAYELVLSPYVAGPEACLRQEEEPCSWYDASEGVLLLHILPLFLDG